MVPERTAAADDVLPEAALRLVQRRRDTVAERRPLERGRDAVLVEAVPALVHRREDRVDVALLVARRQADVLRARAGRERVHRQVEAREGGVEAEALDDLERVLVLCVDGPGAGQEGVVAVDRAVLGDQRHELGFELVEDAPHLRRLHPRLVVVEQDVVRLVVVLEALDVAALQLDGALELGEEEREVVVRARLRPDVMGLGGGARHLGGQLGRHAPRLLPVAPGRADQARLVGVVVETLLVRGELVEKRADLVGDEPLVRDSVEGRHLRAPDGASPRRHHHGLVPEEDLQGPPQVVDLGQACLQLVETLLHRLSLGSRRRARTLAARGLSSATARA